MTRREQLMLELMARGVGPILAKEAISSTAIEHPEWDLDEEVTDGRDEKPDQVRSV